MSHIFFHRLISLFLALAVTLAGVTSALAADGALDPTFGAGGKVITDFGTTADQGSAVALQPDGKIVVAGESSQDFGLSRYNSDGSLDTTFDADGKVLTSFSIGSDIASAIALQPDGRIIAAGYGGDFGDFALARYNSDGSLDITFGSAGKVLTGFGQGDEWVHDIALLADGKIIAAGYSYNFSDDSTDFALARYNSDGSLDTTFDVDGRVRTDFGVLDFGNAIALQPDGKILVAGTILNPNLNTSDFALARYNSDGSLDSTFDSDGKVTTDFASGEDYGNEVALQPDGKIVLAGISEFNFALARYNSDGSLDLTFDSDGKLITDFGTDSAPFEKHGGEAVTIQLDGKIIAAGFSNSNFALARYNSDGSLDTIFDSDGKVTTDFGGNDIGYAIALQPDGKIIVAGSSDSDFALARYDVVASAMEVNIDVKPGRFPNRIQLEKHVCKDDDNLYVAILTTPAFDALNVDTSSLTLGDPNLNGTISPVRSRANDVDGDGDMDMALTFPLCNLVTHEALNTSSTELVLTGMTLNGVSLTGRDSVKVVRED